MSGTVMVFDFALRAAAREQEEYDRQTLANCNRQEREEIARRLAEASNPRLSPDLEARLQKHLNTPLADCIFLALPPDEWALLQLDPQMDRWEAMARLRPRPRIAAVNYGAGTMTMGPWRKSTLKWTER